MKETNLKIKDIDTISISDEINVIETIVSFYFRQSEDEHGNSCTEYTPYLSRIEKIIADAQNLIERIAFDVSEGDSISRSKSLEMKILFDTLMEQIDDIIEYRTLQNIANLQNVSNSIMT